MCGRGVCLGCVCRAAVGLVNEVYRKSVFMRSARHHKRGQIIYRRRNMDGDHFLFCVAGGSCVALGWVLVRKMPCFRKKFCTTPGQGQGAWRGTVSSGSCSLTLSKSHKQGKELWSQGQFEGFQVLMHLFFVDVRARPSHGVHHAAHEDHGFQVLLLRVAPFIHSTRDPPKTHRSLPCCLSPLSGCRKSSTSVQTHLPFIAVLKKENFHHKESPNQTSFGLFITVFALCFLNPLLVFSSFDFPRWLFPRTSKERGAKAAQN